jgi:hypothetical protein
MAQIARWLPYKTAKAVLVLLFRKAKRRVADETDDVAKLPNARIVAATGALNQIADDVRDAQDQPEETSPTIPSRGSPPTIHTVGKILDRTKSNR